MRNTEASTDLSGQTLNETPGSELSCVMAQWVSRRPHTSKGRVILEATPCGIFGGQSDARTGSSLSI